MGTTGISGPVCVLLRFCCVSFQKTCRRLAGGHFRRFEVKKIAVICAVLSISASVAGAETLTLGSYATGAASNGNQAKPSTSPPR